MRERTCPGRSTRTQPRADGPRTTPATISSTTEGSRSRGAKPSSHGAAAPTAQRTTRLVRETSGIAKLRRQRRVERLEQVQPHLAQGGEGRHRVPQPVKRQGAGGRRGGRVQSL